MATNNLSKWDPLWSGKQTTSQGLFFFHLHMNKCNLFEAMTLLVGMMTIYYFQVMTMKYLMLWISRKLQFFLCPLVITSYANLLFNSHDMEKSVSQLMDLDIDICDVWVTIKPHWCCSRTWPTSSWVNLKNWLFLWGLLV